MVKVSAPNLSVLEPVCFQPLNTYRVCLYICLCAFWTSAYRSISPCICLPPPPACLLWAFQPVCLGLLLAGDKRASWQPEAICHPGPFCSAPVRCLLQVCPSLDCPMGPTHKKRLSLLVHCDARQKLNVLRSLPELYWCASCNYG